MTSENVHLSHASLPLHPRFQSQDTRHSFREKTAAAVQNAVPSLPTDEQKRGTTSFCSPVDKDARAIWRLLPLRTKGRSCTTTVRSAHALSSYLRKQLSGAWVGADGRLRCSLNTFTTTVAHSLYYPLRTAVILTRLSLSARHIFITARMSIVCWNEMEWKAR